MKAEYGKRGYPEVVPGSPWQACSVYSSGSLFYTDIYPFMDDPNFQFRTLENSPWLTAAECEIINAPHRKKFWRKEGRTYACDPDAELAIIRALHLSDVEPIYRHRYFHPHKPFRNQWGGYVPCI